MQKHQKRLVFTLFSTMLLSFCVCASAFAQYVWLDEKGVKQFSDTPPPSSVPNNRILKSPNKPGKENALPDSAAATQDADQAKPATTASKNEDFLKRRAEQAEKDQKAAEEQRVASEKSKNCERVQSYQRTLDSGVRIATTDANGERAIMTDEQRAQESAGNKRLLAGCQ
ncbi:DUF4124 domain-containing protein [Undibacterium sp.]|jgi:hypothetical protein|uniref:DUF4124 domain-containing protein n=1 Tax=Undibacterium sp. TaxID=1914977 RepID=UPI002CB31D22|nr:DUF4124 domain-containing protein [Undibacterium sp.]HTD05702.1 DUF4124 domain-containing protein [Undibacterium sp.]